MIRQLVNWLTNLLQPGPPPGGPPAAASPLPLAGNPGASPAPPNHEQAVRLVGEVTELASNLASDVDQHTGNIGALNQELRDIQHGDASAVADVIRKLLAANDELNRRLEQAESKLQAQHRQLQNVVNAARTDSLTGLMNRRCLDEELSGCLAKFMRKGRHSVVVMVDVDHFKQVNDQNGHAVGDLVLKHVASTLGAHYRESDVVARYGGEEFAIIMHGATCETALERAERARAAIGQTPVEVEGRQIQVTASAGIAQTAENDSAVTLLARADAALYAAKRHGRDCSFWFDGECNTLVKPAAEEPLSAPAASEPQLNDEQRSQLELAHEQFGDTTFVANVARRIAEWRRGGATFSVIVARIDDVQSLVQGGGERARSEASRLVCKQAPNSLRDMDLSTRWMSDGLAVLLPGAPTIDAVRVGRRLLAGIQTLKLQVGLDETPLSVSLGIAEGIEGNDAQRVLQRAWQALNVASGQGPGGICLHDGVRIRSCGATVSR